MKKIAILFLMILALTGCVSANVKETSTLVGTEGFQSSTATPAPTASPQPSSTHPAKPTMTLASTKHFYPTSTSTVNPTATIKPGWSVVEDFIVGQLSDSEEFDPEKPWVVYQEGKPDNLLYYYLINLDGGGKTLIFTRIPSWFGNRECKVSPDSQLIACTPADDNYGFDQELIIFSVQQMKIIFRTPLIASSVQEAGEDLLVDGRDMEFQFSDPVTTLIGCGDFEWSPDNNFLAFTSSFEGSTSDIYIYDAETNSSKRLTDGLGETSIIDWSPDSNWIIHSSWVNGETQRMDGTVLPEIEKIWMVNPESEEIQLIESVNWDSAREEVLAWTTGEDVILQSRASFGHGPVLQMVRNLNIRTKETQLLYEENFFYAAFDPETRTLVINNTIYESPPGINIVQSDSSLLNISDDNWFSVDWLKETGWFSAYYWGENLNLLFNPDGEIVDIFPIEKTNYPSVSPDGNFVIFNRKNDHGDMGIRIYSVDGEMTYHLLPDRFFQDGKFYWYPDSSAFIFIQNEGVFKGIIYFSFLDSELIVWEESLEGSFFEYVELWIDPFVLP